MQCQGLFVYEYILIPTMPNSNYKKYAGCNFNLFRNAGLQRHSNTEVDKRKIPYYSSFNANCFYL